MELLRVEFLETDWKGVQLKPVPDPVGTANEITDLLVLKAKERADHLKHIEAQATNSMDYYQRMLMFSERTHPKTYLLLQACIAIGRTVVMYYKNKYQRPRPSQLEPDLIPPIPVPGHASYPSGHSFQQHLEMRVLRELAPSHAKTLEAFALDVAVNRERAGLHYRSDTEAGQLLAERLWPLLSGGQLFKQLMTEAAQQEW